MLTPGLPAPDQYGRTRTFSLVDAHCGSTKALGAAPLGNSHEQLEETGQKWRTFYDMVGLRGSEQNASRAELGQLLKMQCLAFPNSSASRCSCFETSKNWGHFGERLRLSAFPGEREGSPASWPCDVCAGVVCPRGAAGKNAFPFMGVRCDCVSAGVFLRLADVDHRPSEIQ